GPLRIDQGIEAKVEHAGRSSACSGEVGTGSPTRTCATQQILEHVPIPTERNMLYCRRSEAPAPPAASSFQELQIESGTRIICVLVPLCFRSSCQTVPQCITNFGNGALASAQGAFKHARGAAGHWRRTDRAGPSPDALSMGRDFAGLQRKA